MNRICVFCLCVLSLVSVFDCIRVCFPSMCPCLLIQLYIHVHICISMAMLVSVSFAGVSLSVVCLYSVSVSVSMPVLDHVSFACVLSAPVSVCFSARVFFYIIRSYACPYINLPSIIRAQLYID